MLEREEVPPVTVLDEEDDLTRFGGDGEGLAAVLRDDAAPDDGGDWDSGLIGDNALRLAEAAAAKLGDGDLDEAGRGKGERGLAITIGDGLTGRGGGAAERRLGGDDDGSAADQLAFVTAENADGELGLRGCLGVGLGRSEETRANQGNRAELKAAFG